MCGRLTRLAAVDVGTNTVRLLVTEADLAAVERSQLIARLGKGVDASGELDHASIERTVDAVASFVARARELGAGRIRVAGTSALRDASNAGEFAEAVVEATGLPLEVLDGADEGRHAYAGATCWLPADPYVVCDIGGGSTELITADREVSVDIGSVRVRERYVGSDPPSENDVAAARRAIESSIARAVASLALGGSEQLVGVAGTITTLAALSLGLDAYDGERVHGSRMSIDDVTAWTDRLNAMTVAEIRALGPVEPGRADVLGAGGLILGAVMRALHATDVLVSERDILDGLVLDLAERLA